MVRLIEKHEPREYTAFSHDGGVVLCDRKTGAFLVLRFTEDLERLKALLETLEVRNRPNAKVEGLGPPGTSPSPTTC